MMDTSWQHGRSQLFLVRLWTQEEEESDRAEWQWHGRVQHILSGEAHTFRDWQSLVDLLLAMAMPCAPRQEQAGEARSSYQLSDDENTED